MARNHRLPRRLQKTEVPQQGRHERQIQNHRTGRHRTDRGRDDVPQSRHGHSGKQRNNRRRHKPRRGSHIQHRSRKITADHHPFRQEQQLRLLITDLMDGRTRRNRRLDCVFPDHDIPCRRDKQRSEPQRRTRRHDGRTVGCSRHRTGGNGISGRQHHILCLPQHHVCACERGTGSLHGSFRRRSGRLPVV